MTVIKCMQINYSHFFLIICFISGFFSFLPGPAYGQGSAALKKVDVIEQLGKAVNPELVFKSHDGTAVKMGDMFKDGKPVLLTMNYYKCETLCSAQLNGLLSGLKEMDWKPGQEYRIVTVSIDPKEGPALAKGKRSTYLKELGLGEVEWHFLTGHESQIQELADTVGYRFAYDPIAQQYAHPAVIAFLSPKGIVSRYIYGIQYTAQDIKFSLIESSHGRLGSVVDKVIMSCFSYDYSLGKFTPTAFGIMRLGGLTSMFAVGLFSFVMWRKEIAMSRTGSNV